MSNASSLNAASDQSGTSPQTGPHQNEEFPNNPNQSPVQIMPSNDQQLQSQQDNHINVTQLGPQIRQQLDFSPSLSELLSSTNMTEANRDQHNHSLNQQNQVGGQVSYNPMQQGKQQQLSPPQMQPPQQHPQIKPLLAEEPKSDIAVEMMPTGQQSKQDSPQKTIITKVRLSDELNIFDWFRAADIIHQLAEKAKSSVDSVITTLDPGMREYLYSGGNVNVVVISDSPRLVSPIRDSFQDVFGRATVVGARFNPPNTVIDYPIRTACGFAEAAQVATEKIKKLRSDTSSTPQNQVILVVQSALVSVENDIQSTSISNRGVPTLEWFLTYCMLIEDPVLGVTLKSFSQLVPVDQDVIDGARTSRYPETFQNRHLGFTMSIDELMAAKLRLSFEEMVGDDQGCLWLPKWAGIHETQVIRELSLTLANSYRRKWETCAGIETVVS